MARGGPSTRPHREQRIEGATVLDVGCGTGANLPLLVPLAGPEGRIIGVDYSPGMLARARKKVTRNGWSNVELVRGDAAQLDDITEPMDAVLPTYCLGIVHDLDDALERILGVLKPGGRLAILDFHRARAERGPLRWLYPLYRRGLQICGVDSPEDLDDQGLRARWKRGKATLRRRLRDVEEHPFLYDMGFLLVGTKR